MARYIGVDLHRNRFTVCVLAENGREYLSEYRLEQLPQFVRKLRPTDELAVEVTGNTRLFYNAVVSHVAKVVVVNPTQFRVIRQSVKKTDPHDARTLAFYLSKDMLPEVRMKDKLHAQLASLTQTRDTLVKQRTALKNKVNNILSAHGINLRKESLASDVGLDEVLGMTFDAIVADGTAGDRRPDSGLEPEHCGVGEDHQDRGNEIARPREPQKHQGHRRPGGDGAADGDRRHRRLRSPRQTGGLLRHCAASPQQQRNRTLGPDHQTRHETGPNDAGAMRVDRHALQPVLGEVLPQGGAPTQHGQGDHRLGPQVPERDLPHAEEQLGIRGLPELRDRRRSREQPASHVARGFIA